MRIAFVIPSMYGGGAERVISILSNAFSQNGHSVYLLTTEKSDDNAYALSEDIKVYDVSCDRNNLLKSFVGTKRKITSVLKQEKIEVVVSFITRANIVAIWASKEAKVPVIVSERNNPYLVPGNKAYKLIRDVMYQFSDGLVFQTNYARDYFSKSVRKKSVVIINPVSDEVINNRCEYSQKKNVILAACRLDPQKNLELLIRAYANIHNEINQYQLLIYGEGSEKERIEALVQKLGIGAHVKLMGRSSSVIAEMAKAKVFALTSDFEGMPNSLIEAMCVGTACVSTDSPTYGSRALIQDGKNGFLIPVNDESALSDRLLCLATNEALNFVFSERGKELYDKTNTAAIISQWEGYINRVIDLY